MVMGTFADWLMKARSMVLKIIVTGNWLALPPWVQVILGFATNALFMQVAILR